MGATAEPAAEQSMAHRMGFKPSQVVQEFGYDDDVDEQLRLAIETLTGTELADEDAQDVVDAAIHWWRAHGRPRRARRAERDRRGGPHRRPARHQHDQRGHGLDRHPAGLTALRTTMMRL